MLQSVPEAASGRDPEPSLICAVAVYGPCLIELCRQSSSSDPPANVGLACVPPARHLRAGLHARPSDFPVGPPTLDGEGGGPHRPLALAPDSRRYPRIGKPAGPVRLRGVPFVPVPPAGRQRPPSGRG